MIAHLQTIEVYTTARGSSGSVLTSYIDVVLKTDSKTSAGHLDGSVSVGWKMSIDPDAVGLSLKWRTGACWCCEPGPDPMVYVAAAISEAMMLHFTWLV